MFGTGQDAGVDQQVVRFRGRGSIERMLSTGEVPTGRQEMLLDFRNIASVGSLELSALINFCLKLRKQDVRVCVTNVGPRLREIFEITRFTRLAEVRVEQPVVEQAVES